MSELLLLAVVGLTLLGLVGTLMGLGLIKLVEWLADDWYADVDEACAIGSTEWVPLHSDEVTQLIPVDRGRP